jgi:sporadic carbohydrate cluster protein (TIGR04323 family)
MTGFKGYIASRAFQGHRAPQHVQNLVIRDYCTSRNMTYLLSGTEYAIPGSFLILQQLINDLEALEGIVFYSMFQMPQNAKKRTVIYDDVLEQGKSLHFAVEGLSLSNRTDCRRLEDIWSVFLTMPNVPNIEELV